MKFKTIGIRSLLLFAGTQIGHAAYVTGFEQPPYNHSLDLAGQQGWTINDNTLNLSSFAFWNGDWAAYLGGFYDAPAVVNVDLSHSYDLPMAGSSFGVDFTIIGSSASYPGRDSFGFSLKEGVADLMRVAFEPGAPGRLEVLWYDNLNVGHTLTPVSQDIFYSGSYVLTLKFNPSGADTAFVATLTGSNTFTWGGILPGTAGAYVSSFSADYDVEGVEAGDNFMLFDGISIIPEPASAGLAGLGMLLLMRRRRN